MTAKKNKIDDYQHIMFTHDKWSEFVNGLFCVGLVTIDGNPDIAIPIILDPSLNNGLSIPQFACKSTNGLIDKKNQKNIPWIIKCGKNDVINLIESNLTYLVALYHEIGHFHFNDGVIRENEDEYRKEQLKMDKVPNEEILADKFVVSKFGKEKVIAALKEVLTPIVMNPSIINTEEGKLFVKELKMRIKTIENN